MEEFVKWFFEGIGTFIIGLILGGTGGYVICYYLKFNIKSIDKSKHIIKGRKIFARRDINN